MDAYKIFSYLFNKIELSPLHKKLMIERFVHHKTFRECMETFGLTRERIRQIEAKTLRKIRKYQDEHPDWMEELL